MEVSLIPVRAESTCVTSPVGDLQLAYFRPDLQLSSTESVRKSKAANKPLAFPAVKTL